MILSLIPTGEHRPSVLESNKDATYHLKFARYCLGQANSHLHSQFLAKIAKNKRFYKGDQWSETEDIDTFLKDEDNQDRNRLAVVDNIIRPLVENYRGNAIRMNVNFKTKSISPQAVNRREVKLQENLTYSDIANKPGNPFSEAMKANLPIGDTEAETRAIFNNSYVDDFARAINNLSKFVTERNKFEDKQVRIAEEMAFTGLAVMTSFEYAGHMNFRVVPSDTFFWDRTAREYDLSDAAFMGEILYLTPSEIYERWPDMTAADREAVDKYASHFGGSSDSSTATNTNAEAGKVPVCMVYWTDGQAEEYGYVLDQYGYEYLTKINFIYEGETEPRYTDKDLIESKSFKAKQLGLKAGKLKRRLYYDTLRTAVFIPSEVLSSVSPNSRPTAPDIILDWGLAPYQETENIEFNTVKKPYKCYCWAYIDGEVMSPIDDAIDPQRMVNRILSVAENQINNSRGSGMVYDKSMLDDEGEALRNMNQSKPVGIMAKGRGIQNAIGTYDATIKQGTTAMYEIVEAIKSATQRTTGVNDALKGESMGSDQLVGVTQLMIQRGSLMQEPFYNGITNVFKQCIQAIATVGKRIYSENGRNLAIAIGDDLAEIITISKEMRAEDFRSFVTRENSDEMLRTAADQMLLQLISANLPTGPLLDGKRFAELYGRGTPDDVAAALRAYAKEREELQRSSAKASQQEEAALSQQAEAERANEEQMMFEMQARDDVKDMANKEHDLKKEFIKATSKIAPKNRKAENYILEKSRQVA